MLSLKILFLLPVLTVIAATGTQANDTRYDLAWGILSGREPTRTFQERSAPSCSYSAISNPRFAFVCGNNGYIKHPNPIQTLSASSMTACLSTCENTKRCISFSFVQSTGQCVQYTQAIKRSNFVFNNAGAQFWNRHCFKNICGLCPINQNLCGGSCFDLTSDNQHCGSCTNSCGNYQTCVSSTCTCNASGNGICNGVCFDLQNDPNNCGYCGGVCSATGTICSTGLCQCSNDNQQVCDNACTNTQNDSNNCGDCGVVCAATGTSCSGGQCQCSTSGQQVCGTACTDLQTDSNNCGDCDNVCTITGTTCSAGQCQCSAPGQQVCGNTCMDTQNDPNNCGSCGYSCPVAGSACSAGQCQCLAASPQTCGNICVNTENDSDNCGTCGTSCSASGTVCSSGQCQCSADNEQVCGNACTDTQNDSSNCGACGNSCTATGTICAAGQCQCSTNGQQVCGNACTDTQTDPVNCGSCGNACTGSDVCSSGTCQNITPPVVLGNPIPINDVENGETTTNQDDLYYLVNLPFNVTFYNVSSSTLWISVNGFVGLSSPPIYNFSDYTNQPLPYNDGYFPDTGIMPFWDDLYLYSGTPQGLYFEVDNVGQSYTVTFEWYTSHYLDPSQYYHFTMQLSENQPNSVVFKYYQISDSGVSATIGAQSISQGLSSQYSFNTADITNGLQLTFNPSTNTFS